MSEIEKLYELVGFKRSKPSCAECFLDRHSCCRSYNECPELYPPFTAEKQLELIKLLSYYYNITISKNFENNYTFQCEGDDVRPYVFTSGQDFAEQLAVFVNMCFEYLPEEEKQQVKGILE